jgi:glycosyltransferase involved in cell wall biosynthesis
MVVRPNASVDPEDMHAARRGEPGTPRTAIVAGRLVAFKGISLSIQAIAQLPDWTLEVVGVGPDAHRLRRMANDIGVADRVAFIPWRSQEDLWKRMTECSVVMVPSIREAAGFVVAEAAALGTPVVALDQGGPRVLARLSPRQISVVDARSPGESVRGIVESVKAAQGVPRYPAREFSIDAIADVLDQVYAIARTENDVDHLEVSVAGVTRGADNDGPRALRTGSEVRSQ